MMDSEEALDRVSKRLAKFSEILDNFELVRRLKAGASARAIIQLIHYRRSIFSMSNSVREHITRLFCRSHARYVRDRVETMAKRIRRTLAMLSKYLKAGYLSGIIAGGRWWKKLRYTYIKVREFYKDNGILFWMIMLILWIVSFVLRNGKKDKDRYIIVNQL